LRPYTKAIKAIEASYTTHPGLSSPKPTLDPPNPDGVVGLTVMEIKLPQSSPIGHGYYNKPARETL
jgi:hypothetical protein